ncbi:serine/threonine protein kinase [Acanthopleuribacter pedis]|uniref:Protein kinase n=1 Tax=Acanthopleuribacter pedis TaxID=442870 RepID=A0A8J7QIM8_9BACT|nr:serine/threonine-protein kinase [Acanthopleuribacter pedis]MBO1321020.1 protein kinase [Acanthopleuribacter pedis]
MSPSLPPRPKGQGSPDPLIGRSLGPYRVVRLIGSGGMGRVYEGHQTGAIKKKVALKVMRRDHRSELMRRRFELELQTLASLSHPNIATILVSGARDDGENWFAMEYVEGSDLITYCEEKRLKAPARLKLFIKICDAVHYAHQRGIIHRDLKPANILIREVDGLAEPKIIDFGIAKVTAEEKPKFDQATMVTEVTAPGMTVGTVGYMSPEQTHLGEDTIDVRCDIYSLGVVLYELLVGNRPLDDKRIQSGTWDQAFALVREHEPERPSKAVKQTAIEETTTLIDVSSVSGLSKYYRGDLDWIVLKAMEKDRERRYQGADLFAKDIHNFLGRLPITAGPPTWRYQTKRFAQRNKALVAGLAFVLVGIIAGMYGLVYGYIQAKEREAQAIREATSSQETLRFLQGAIGSNKVYLGPTTRIIDRFTQTTDEVNELNILPSTKARILYFFAKTHKKTGNYNSAESFITEGLKIQTNTQNKTKLLLDSKYELLSIKKFQRSSTDFTREIQELLTQYSSILPKHHEKIIRMTCELSYSFTKKREFKKALETLNTLSGIKWNSIDNGNSFYALYKANLGSIYYHKGDYNKAIPILGESFSILKNSHLTTSHMVTECILNLPWALGRTGKIEEAIIAHEDISSEMIKLWGHDHPRILVTNLNSHTFYIANKEYIKSINIIINTLSLLGKHKDSYKYNVLLSLSNLGYLLNVLGYKNEAIHIYEEVLTEKEESFGSIARTTINSLEKLAELYQESNPSEIPNLLPRFLYLLLEQEGDYLIFIQRLIPILTRSLKDESKYEEAYAWECAFLDKLLENQNSNLELIEEQYLKIEEIFNSIKAGSPFRSSQ